jgi:hypothetical protein
MKLPTPCAFTLALLAGLLTLASTAGAQAVCSSDGQRAPSRLLDRFINANCASCWTDPATPKSAAGQAALDWVLPGDKGDDAPLSAVATRDGLQRLEALRQPLPDTSSSADTAASGLKGAKLRIAHGLALKGYLGASIELKPIPPAARGRRWSGWLALVEVLPAGSEGSPVERHLVRNLLEVSWDGGKKLAKGDPNRYFDARAMAIAEGVNPEKLRLIGWVEYENGRMLSAAQSSCEP